jgi:hemerythrin superfamily protein
MLKALIEKVLSSDGVIGMLKDDHRKVEKLFEEFEDAQEEKDRGTMLRAIQEALKELEVHAAIEEEIVYPAMRQEIDDEMLMDEALEEHHVAHVLIDELRAMSSTDKRYAAKFKVLAESIKHHVKEEESELFPKAAETDFETPQLKERVLARKQQLLTGKSDSRSRTTAKMKNRTGRRSRSARGTRRQRAA